ncbi:hypothetical protein DFH08DRAFT_402854 [Mycena albidolilacea]|uniref:Uncharacterized protein n=1 Tax=Mycena albidolilacea TaxID=1033008 RepID=A0AAD7AHC7_9AGAR|nr:hypothetical protein DFH08DRAFT_402854 [Mycena albidolilacea]
MAYHLNDGSEFNASGGTFYVIGRDLNQRCVHVDGNPGAYNSRTVVNIGYPDLGSPPFDPDPTHPPQQTSRESLRSGPPTPRRGAGTGSYSGHRMEPYHLSPEGRPEFVQRPPGQSTRSAAPTPRLCPETPRHMDHLPYARPSQQVLGTYYDTRYGSVPSPQRAHATESISPPAPAQQSELGNLSGPHFATSDLGVEAPNLFEPTPIGDDLETKESSLYGQKTLETVPSIRHLGSDLVAYSFRS